MNPYYYIYRTDETRGPKIKHPTLESAQTEAERLANQHPGSTFEILKAVAVVRCTVASTFWMNGEAPSKTVEPDVPEHYPPFDLPKGYDRWVYRGLGWKAEQVKYVIWSNKKWDRCAFPYHSDANGISDLEYWEAVKDATDPAYRDLVPGEVIRTGDEWLDNSDRPARWKLRDPIWEERFNPASHTPHRRKL